ncbi:hypothetical protein D3C76_1054360 [compost metagenome]|uniref:Uncharacterized protein n=1 Tax=Pseudomonas fluorescens TaxID=294 RepID=A0A5E7UAM8_PSEFL|nr:hypothetical protein [Pseudomonas fluorescens]VVQ07459.1 hypothetical protein PS938_03159 [Pseudomonas fluorescens]
MSKGGENQVSFSDTKKEAIKVVEGAEGHITLEVHRDGEVQKLETTWFNFYIESWRTVIEAFFGEDTGVRVPAVMLLAEKALKVGTYEIKNPFDNPPAVVAIYGKGRPGAVSGDGWGKGKLIISEVSSAPSGQSIKGSFEFLYHDAEGVLVKVVTKEFWAKNNG